jgi:hypothetical protein
LGRPIGGARWHRSSSAVALQSAIADRAGSSDMATLRVHMSAMVHGYLKEMQRVLARARRRRPTSLNSVARP